MNISKHVPTQPLGHTSTRIPRAFVGTWSWGNWNLVWGKTDRSVIQETFDAAYEAGMAFDASEVYGFGESETMLRDFRRKVYPRPQVMTKVAPAPWRFTKSQFFEAAKGCRQRLADTPDILLQHYPGFGVNTWSNHEYLEGLAMAREQGVAAHIGVSNFNSDRVVNAYRCLKSRGIDLVANQLQHSLLYRKHEKSGLIRECQDLGMTVFAYSPLAQGLLTQPYGLSGIKPDGWRQMIWTDARRKSVFPLLNLMEGMAIEHQCSLSQVALAWSLKKGVVPVVGCRHPKHVENVVGAFDVDLNEYEVHALDAMSDRVTPYIGNFFEDV